MEKNAILAAVLSIAVLIAWEYFYLRPYREQVLKKQQIAANKKTAEERKLPLVKEKSLPLPSAPQAEKQTFPPIQLEVAAIGEKRIRIDVGPAVYEFTNRGAALVSARLKSYLSDKDRKPIDLVEGTNPSIKPFYFLGNSVSPKLNRAVFRVEGSDMNLSPSRVEGKVRFLYSDGSGLFAEKTFKFRHNSYVIHGEFKVQREKGQSIGVAWGPRLGGSDHNTYGGVIEGPMSMVGKELEYEKPEIDKPVVRGTEIKWTALQTKYFIAAFIPRSGTVGSVVRLLSENKEQKNYAVIVPFSEVPQSTAALDIFVGPKETKRLAALDVNLEDSLDYGMFSFIARPLMSVLRVFHFLTGNWGVAIILLTVLIKIVFYPLTQVSMRNMRNMQKLQPKMTQIREIYKDNRERMNQEVMALYKENKVNPMMGCLPMIIQIPVFFGLYQALLVSIELRQAPFFGWIVDLSKQDPFHVFTVLMGASMFLQQKMTPTTGDPAQAKMMMLMPVIFTGMFIFYPVPVGLVIYWFMNNVLSIAQQYYVNKSITPPKLAES